MLQIKGEYLKRSAECRSITDEDEKLHTGVAKCQWQALMLSEEKQIRLKMYAYLVPSSDGRLKKHIKTNMS